MDKEHIKENTDEKECDNTNPEQNNKTEYNSASDIEESTQADINELNGSFRIPSDEEASQKTFDESVSANASDNATGSESFSEDRELINSDAEDRGETVFITNTPADDVDATAINDESEDTHAESEAQNEESSGEQENEGDDEHIFNDADENEDDKKESPEEKSTVSTDKNTDNRQKSGGLNLIFDMVELLIFSLVAVLFITAFGFRHSVVEGSSMEQTLFEGEHLIISDLFYTPKRGDIVVCEDYTTILKKPIVKRVIAIEGDHIVVNILGEVYINGELTEEDYVFVDGVDFNPAIVDMIVPEGEIFVMGDHRNLSSDSREIGTVSVDSVLGKVMLRIYPFDRFGTVK